MTDLGIVGVGDATLIASGGTALVYRARTGTGEDVAVKVLRGMRGAEVARRFEREQSAAARLTGHAHIMSILDNGITPAGEPYLVMPLIAGGSLADELDARGPCAVGDAIADVATAAAAIEFAHDRGVLHRDIKPGNLLRADDGSVIVSDFGIARVVDAGITSATVGASTPLYAAPELLAENDASVQSDVYALGALLYTLLAGEAAFADSQNIWGTMHRIRTESPPPIPHVPEPVMRFIARAMAKDPEDRPASAAAFRAELLGAFRGASDPMPMPLPAPLPVETVDLGVGPAPHGLEPPPAPPLKRRPGVVGSGPGRESSSVKIVAAFAAVIVVAGLGWFATTQLLASDDDDASVSEPIDTSLPSPGGTAPGDDPTAGDATTTPESADEGSSAGDAGDATTTERFVSFTGAHFSALLPEGWSLQSKDVDVGYGYRSRFVAEAMYLTIDTTPRERRTTDADIAASARDIASGISSASEVRSETVEGLTMHFFTFRNTSGVDSIDIFFEVDGDGYAIVAGSTTNPQQAFATARQVASSVRSTS